MEVMYLLIAFSLILATGFLLAFIWAVRSGQYDDRDTPSMRMLIDDVVPLDRKKKGKKEGGKTDEATPTEDIKEKAGQESRAGKKKQATQTGKTRKSRIGDPVSQNY